MEQKAVKHTNGKEAPARDWVRMCSQLIYLHLRWKVGSFVWWLLIAAVFIMGYNTKHDKIFDTASSAKEIEIRAYRTTEEHSLPN